jgi:hypothetical protein
MQLYGMDSKANAFSTSSPPRLESIQSDAELLASTQEDAKERAKIRLIAFGVFGFIAVMMGIVISHDIAQQDIYDKRRAEWCSTHAETCAAQREEKDKRDREERAYFWRLVLEAS